MTITQPDILIRQLPAKRHMADATNQTTHGRNVPQPEISTQAVAAQPGTAGGAGASSARMVSAFERAAATAPSVTPPQAKIGPKTLSGACYKDLVIARILKHTIL